MPKQRQSPRTTAETDRLAAEKRERLAAALRANLRRRKAQQRKSDVDGDDPDRNGTPA
jgi:hypothetical protein